LIGEIRGEKDPAISNTYNPINIQGKAIFWAFAAYSFTSVEIYMITSYYIDMFFAWDEEKNQKNRDKHGVWFEEAKTVFEDRHARVFFDEGHSDDEERFLIIGKSCFEKILIVIHCYRLEDEVVRIISRRKVTKSERKIYEEGV